MASRDDLNRLFNRQAPFRRSNPPPAAAPAPSSGAPTSPLPPAPAGYQYMWDGTHGRYILVQVALPGAAPQAPSRLVAPSGMPIGAPGPAGTRSAQLLRPGVDAEGNVVDKYGEFLSRYPDLDPTNNPVAQQLYPHLVPDPEQTMQRFPPPRPLHEKERENPDPVADAWGGRTPSTRATGLD